MATSDKASDQSQPHVPTHTPTAEPPWPNSAYAWYVVILLMVLYMFSFIDRTIIVLMIEPIKRDLDLSDTQISLLYGFAFAVFYTFLGIPIARLADYRSRRNIIAAGVAIWSVMTAVCGLSKNFLQLFAARVGVGVGEATLSPAAYSLISDYFPEEQRAKAMSVYTMGLYLGAGMAVLLGGAIIGLVDSMPTVTLPVVGTLYSWQIVFVVVGLPGLLFSLLMFTVKEPLRRGLSTTPTQRESLGESLGYFLQRWRFYIMFCCGMACLVMYSYALTAWTPSYFIRTFGWDVPTVSLNYGLILVIFGPAGIITGGWVASRQAASGDAFINVRLAIITFAALLIPATIMTLVNHAYLSLAILALVKFLTGLPLGVAVAALHEVTPNRLRAQSAAVYFFLINILGLGVGPLLVALLTDYVFQNEAALRYSLAVVACGSCIVGLLLVSYSFKEFKRLKTSQA